MRSKRRGGGTIALVATAGISLAFGVRQLQTAVSLSNEQRQTQSALKQAVDARAELEGQRSAATTQAQIAKDNETAAKDAQKKAEMAEQLSNERLATIRRHLYSADMNLAHRLSRCLGIKMSCGPRACCCDTLRRNRTKPICAALNGPT